VAYLTIHRLDGNPDQLLRQKRETFDPTVRALAGQYGALFSVTAKTADGLLVINVWESAEGAAAFTQLPAIQQAQRASGLPRPSSFERYLDAQLDAYQHPGANRPGR